MITLLGVLPSSCLIVRSSAKTISCIWATVKSRGNLMVKRILKKYKYPPDQAESAIDLVLQQLQTVGEEWTDQL
jgi:type I restriction enzyme R subunit